MENEEQPKQTPPPSQPPKKQLKKPLLIGGIILGLLLVGIGGYFLGMNQKADKEQKPQSTPSITMVSDTPTPSIATPTDSGIPINANTVSFTRVNGAVYLRYKGHIYSETAANKNDYSLTNLPNPDTYTWYGLVDAPAIPANTGFDELFDFKVFPNKYNFVFIMRWPVDNQKTDYKVFYYDVYQAGNKVTNLFTSTQGNNGNEYTVARLNQVSSDGKYVAFSMFACWNCGGHAPDTLLYNMTTKASKRIGKTSYFNWKENGKYEYKEYKTITCPPPDEGPGECSENPNNLPLLTGSF